MSVKDIPLDPGVGGRSLSTAALQAGDIIISTTNAVVSKIIKLGTGSVVSHAMLYIGNETVVEAISMGVTYSSINNALSEALVAGVYRHSKITPAAAKQVVQYAEELVGRQYDTIGALGAGLISPLGKVVCVMLFNPLPCVFAKVGAMNNKTSFYCSELVLEAFTKAGLPIAISSSDKSTPETIVQAYHNDVIKYVGHLIA